MVAELSAYTEAVGYSDPLQKIYLTTSKLDHVSTAMFILTLSQVCKQAARQHHSLTALVLAATRFVIQQVHRHNYRCQTCELR